MIALALARPARAPYAIADGQTDRHQRGALAQLDAAETMTELILSQAAIHVNA